MHALFKKECQPVVKKTAKRRTGRPVTTGIRPYWGARFPKELADEIDRYAKTNRCNRSEAIRRIVEEWVASRKP
jgi:hypothetical protein